MRSRLATAAVGGLLVSGAAVLVTGLATRHDARVPPAIAAPSSQAPAPGPAPADSRVLPRSVPARLDIPAIDVHSALLELGLNPDGTVQVPPLARDSRAGWYRYSPTPGQLGPAVILGHVDSAKYGPGVFYRLGSLRPGELVDVTRADRRTAVFRIDRVAEYPKAHFPTKAVYGDVDHAALRLVTCGGAFDRDAGSYLDNIVVYASLVRSWPDEPRMAARTAKTDQR